MYREIIVPTQSDFTIHLPATLIGKNVEVIAFEINGIENEPLNNSQYFNNEKLIALFNKYEVDMADFKFDRKEATNFRGYAA